MTTSLAPASRLERSWVDTFLNSPDEPSPETVLVNSLLDSDAEAIHEKLSRIFSHLSDGKEAQQAFRENGGIPAVVHVMANNLPDKLVQTQAAAILATLAEDDEIATEIGEREGVQAIVDLLRLHRNDINICQAAVSALRALTFVAKNRALMLQYNVTEILIGIMKEFEENESLAECIPATVANIMFGCNKIRVQSGELGAITCFTKGLKVHATSAKVVTQCAFGIRNLVWDCPPNLERVVEDNTIDVLLKSLSKHRECPEAVTQILGGLSNMVSVDSNIRAKMLNEKLFFQDMFHILSFFVAESCLCATLSFVLFTIAEHDMQYDRLYARVIASHCKENDGYKAIISALEHAIQNKNKDAIAKVCHLIHVFCISEEFRRDMGRAKILDVPVKALQDRVFEDEISISKLLCCIRGIVSGNDKAKLMFRELNGFPMTLEIMTTNTKSLKVILKCTQVLDNTADGQLQTTEQLLDRKDETIRELQAAMSNFPECPSLQENACSILVKIASISREEASKLTRAGVRPSVELAKSRHAGNPGVESLANQLLSLLVDSSSGREGRKNVRGNASARLRSRSRTVESGGRSRSRADKSKSPDRMMKQARRAIEAAKMRQGVGKEVESTHRQRSGSGAAHSKRGARNKISLEPVYE